MHLALRLASSRESPEISPAGAIEDRLHHDRTGGVSRAKEQHVVNLLGGVLAHARVLWYLFFAAGAQPRFANRILQIAEFWVTVAAIGDEKAD